MKERECWVDNVKVIACILVVLGHFFQSMVKSQIMADSNLYEWFNTTIYYFHVPLFFICSGYLYQKYCKISWGKNILKKALVLGVPYVTFTTITWVLKTVFSSSVNDQIGLLWNTLLLNPTSPYWYLYCLFLCFIVTPIFKNKVYFIVGFVVSIGLKAISLIWGGTEIYAINVLMANEIWFVIGMCLLQIKFSCSKRWYGVFGFAAFIVLSILVYVYKIEFFGCSFLLGLFACTSMIVGLHQTDKSIWLSKYTMPVFLMHTIFAALIRVLLIKVGISNPIIHVIFGLAISFAGPIMADVVMRKMGYIDFILYPNKYVKV